MSQDDVPLSSQVSVVIPHYGDPAHAQTLVAALRADQHGELLEIIVSDDCSPRPFPESNEAIVNRLEQNGGFGSAVNSGAALATREYLLVLNSDLDIPTGFVENLLRAAKPWLPAVVAPALVSDDGEPQWSGRHFPRTRHYVTEWLRPLARWRERRILHEAVGHDTRCVPGNTVITDWLVGAVLLLPTVLFRSEGGFDERFFMYCEETDLQRRLREKRVPSVYLGELEVRHAGGASSDSTRRLGWLFTSRFFYARKWKTGAARMHTALVTASIVNFLFGCVRRLTGRGENPVTVFRAELATLKKSASDAEKRTLTPVRAAR